MLQARRISLSALILAFGLALSISPASAASRNESAAATGGGKQTTAPDASSRGDAGKTPDGPRETSPVSPSRGDDERPGQTGDGGGGGSIDGLPDAVTVLEILRRLPKWPPGGRFDDPIDGAGPEDRPATDGPGVGVGGPASRPLAPSRVVTIAPNVPFKPKPTPRPSGAGAAVTGASVTEALDREVLVTLVAGSGSDTVFALSQDFGLDGQTLYTSSLLGVRVVRFGIPDTRAVADVVQQLGGDARVEIAEPHYIYTASQGAAKPLPVPQYAPAKLKLSDAHKISLGKRVKVAVIDTAIDTAHPAFKGAAIETFDALGGTRGEAELHGTAIAGIVGARQGLESVAPEASLLSVRAFTAEKGATARSFTLAILKGLDWAVNNGARVINMSFAGPQDPILAKAIAAAEAQGVVLVAAAGNGGADAKPAYPAALPEVIAVTATDDGDQLYKDANRGSYIAVAAPGVDIIAAAPKGAYDISSGTSLAAAHVSGIAALMLERNPKLTSKDVREALVESAHKISGKSKDEVGAGVADAAGALNAVR